MRKLLLILRTVVHLKPVQVFNRLWRKRPMGDVKRTPLARRGESFWRLVSWPSYPARWDGGSSFTFLNETRDCATAADWNAPDAKKLWLYNLHYFDVLRAPEASGAGDRRNAETALVLRWIDENPVGRGNGWEPYPISLRVVNWIKWLSHDAGTGRDELAKIEQSLCVQVRWLAKRLEYHLLANHLLANAKALVFAGLYFAGAEADSWLATGLSIYRRQLPEQVLADGVHFELSAMYHSIMLEDLLDCVNALSAASGVSVEADSGRLAEFASRMLGGLGKLTGPDGRIVKFNDAAEGIALAPMALRRYASELGIKPAPGGGPEVDFDVKLGSGFMNLHVDEWTLVAKCGKVGPGYQPGHAHADSLSFELWKGTEKLVTDTGTDRYVVDAERRRQRGSAAHNVVVVGGRDSSEVWGGHRVARRARVLGWSLDSTPDQKGYELGMGIRDVAGVEWRRTLELTPDGLTGIEELAGRLREGETVEARFHCPAGAREHFELSVDDASVTWEECDLAEEFGKLVKGECAVARVQAKAGLTLTWHIR